jgi:hypothetical protein
MNNLGINLNSINYYSPQHPFVNVQKTARRWVTQNGQFFDTNESIFLDLDKQGWVRSLPDEDSDLAFRWIYSSFRVCNSMLGTYTVTYEGEGLIEYGGGVKLISSRPGKDIIEIESNACEYRIKRINPDNYIRNINIVPEDANLDEIFNLTFLEHISFADGFRAMDWQETNSSTFVEWKHRPLPEQFSYGLLRGNRAGVPLEIICELANETNKRPWFCIPHKADNNFVKEMALLIKEKLSNRLDFIIEYSNEVWNSQFQQSNYCHQMAMALNLPDKHVYYSKRAIECFMTFDRVFRAEQDRVIGVLSGQAANPWTIKQILKYDLWGGERHNHEGYGVDAIACAPYFGSYIGRSENQEILELWAKSGKQGLTNLYDEIRNGGDLVNSPEGGALKQSYDWMGEYIRIANNNSLKCMAYECGQHLSIHEFESDVISDFLITANLDPSMEEVYIDYINKWFELGGDDLEIFSDVRRHDKHGSWGISEELCREDPKYKAVFNIA